MSLKTNAPYRGRIMLKAITADITLVPEDTGITFMLDAVGEAITIPTPVGNRGVHYRFVCVADIITSAWVITAGGTNLIHCQFASGAGDDVDVISAGTGKDAISIIHTVALEGDFVEMYSTGTFWMATGHTVVAEGITVA